MKGGHVMNHMTKKAKSRVYDKQPSENGIDFGRLRTHNTIS